MFVKVKYKLNHGGQNTNTHARLRNAMLASDQGDGGELDNQRERESFCSVATSKVRWKIVF